LRTSLCSLRSESMFFLSSRKERSGPPAHGLALLHADAGQACVRRDHWVVDLVAPLLSREPGARGLLEPSRSGELTLHVPAIALAEARKVVRERRPHAHVESIRAFVGDMKARDVFDESVARLALDVLTRSEQYALKGEDGGTGQSERSAR
jgi:hypothetical protein